MNSYNVTITGITPLLLHRDNIEFADQLARWREEPSNKKLSKAGDDRTPAFTWLGCLYEHDGLVVMPSDNLMRCFMEGGASVPVPGGKNGKTFKAQTQSGMMTAEPAWAIEVRGKTIDAKQLYKLQSEMDFERHKAVVEKNGFSLFVKRAKIGSSKHIRVRPKFHEWTLRGRIDVWDEQITKDALMSILSFAGDYKGLGDWRPSGRTPGPHGRFRVELQKV